MNEEGKRSANCRDDQCEDENSEVGKSISKTSADTLSTHSLKEKENSSKTQLANDNEINENSREISKEINTCTGRKTSEINIDGLNINSIYSVNFGFDVNLFEYKFLVKDIQSLLSFKVTQVHKSKKYIYENYLSNLLDISFKLFNCTFACLFLQNFRVCE